MAMFMKTLYTPGVAHLSYIFGDDGKASVIDPRRDVDEYLDIAHRLGAKITHIFETHRNEDYVSGALELARRTGAEIYHGSQLDFHFGNPVNEGDEFHLGNIKLSILHTPGHTMESISIVYHDQAFSDGALGVFTGDALFIGDVGRTDFYPDRAEEVAGMLYDSIFQKLLPLGDHVLLWPAHGAGSVCGSGIAERDFSTLGYERKHNPVLQKTDREEFVRFKIDEGHFVSPHFRQMEAYNLKGAPPLDYLPIPMPLSPDEFARAADDGMRVVDIRSPEAFAGAHLPKSFSLPLDALPAFAGMFLPYDQSLGLVVEDYSQIEEAVQGLTRIGYDKIDGFLAGGLHAWETSGRDYGRIEAIYIKDLEQRLEAGVSFTLLDVRSKEEFESGHLRTAVHVYLGDLPSKLKQIPKRRPITTICESGRRATIAAAFLGRQGMEPVEVCLGPMKACSQLECQVKTGDRRDASTEP